MTGTALIQRATIDEVVGYRNAAIAKFQVAFDAIDDALKTAAKAAGGTHFYIDRSMAEQAFSSYDAGHTKVLTYLRQQTDRAIWSYLINGFGFEKLMDRQAREEFRTQLEKDPPEVDVDVAHMTLQALMGDADKIFRRGIANAFAKLDRRFRSHDGFKIGDRVVLDNAFDVHGSWNYYRRHDDTIRDIERAFMQLDGKEMPDDRYAGIIGVVDEAKRVSGRALEMHPFLVENDYFKIRGFKNGNCHIWFKRSDLLVKVNKLLAEHYGEVLGAGSDAVEDDPLSRPNTNLAKNLGWFPTPPAVVAKLMQYADISYVPSSRPTLKILEPSAGEGAVARGIKETAPADTEITCVEIHAGRCDILRSGGLRVINEDFLAITPEPIYDRIIMNPPFDQQRDIDHVAHAVRFLAPGGKLVAVMSASVEFRENKKAVAFRKLIERMRGEIIDLPQGSFAESNTMVNTCIVTLSRPRTAS